MLFTIDDFPDILYNKHSNKGNTRFSGYIDVELIKDNQKEGIPQSFSQKKVKSKKGTGNSWYYFGIAGQIGFAIALPIAGGAIIGSSLDRKLNSYPKCTLLLLVIWFGLLY